MEISPENVEIFSKEFRDHFFKNSGISLDFSKDSIALVESLMDYFIKGRKSFDQISAAIFGASCYIGEVIRKNLGAAWIRGEYASVPDDMKFPLMMKLGEDYFCPYTKMCKRFENGQEDSIAFYYAVIERNIAASTSAP